MRKRTLEILNHFAKLPERTISEVAKDLGYSYQTVYMAKRNHTQKTEQSEPKLIMEVKTDLVNSPAHYLVGGIEAIDFIEAKQLNYNLGNAVKYIARADHKGNRKQDIEKAIWYLKREISRIP